MPLEIFDQNRKSMPKWRYAAALSLLIFSACGGGGSPSPAVPITMTPAKSPVLVTYTSNSILSAFPPSAAIPDGTPVHFAASSLAISVIPATATVSGGVTKVRVKSSVPGKYLVTATSTVGSTVYAGSVSVTFITQPAQVTLSIALEPTVANLGGLQLSVLNDTGVGAFQNITNNSGMLAYTNLSTGRVPPNNRTNVGAISATGITVTSTNPLLLLTYAVTTTGGLPGFTVDAASVKAYHADLIQSPITPLPDVLLNWKYDTDIY